MNTTLVEAVVNNVAVLLPCRMVHSYERGVRFRWGRDHAVLSPGLHWFVPGAESIEIVNVAPETHNLPTQSAYTKDGKAVTFSGNICYRIVDARKMFVSVQSFDDALAAFAMVHIAAHIATVTLATLRRNREAMESAMAEALSEKVAEWGAEIEWFGLTDVAETRAFRLFGDALV